MQIWIFETKEELTKVFDNKVLIVSYYFDALVC